MRPLRILQVGYFDRKRLQRRWFNTEHKLAQGLARAGHFVLRFSDRDEARGATLIASQKIGAKRMNERLVETARHFRPQLILFHHADLIAADTYDALREASPGTRLTQVCVDSVERPATMAAFSARAAHVDISFMTTADAEALRRLAPREGSIAFLPNPVDPSVETARVFDIPASDLPWDAVFLGNGYGNREEQLAQIKGELPEGFRFHVEGGAFDTRRLSSLEFLETLANGAMSPSIPIDDGAPVPFLYSSDRMAQLLGQGVVALTPASARQSTLYDDGVVEFASPAECAAAMADLWRDDVRRRRIGETGWRIAHSRTNSTRVARYLCEAVFRETFSEPYEWPVEWR